ncbi:matrixin family metalloprotease [Aeoliella mucimassa]|uniref:Matrixin n=1 Tax=Aeoliella mucimassa TaxID=2527972 RepID=A0A518ARK2_9BACT|nr:matrixin family metalloprotease [Aeoliella mucimassa]QDU57351.1 Matrixin [Aeoliella mucimassa]
MPLRSALRTLASQLLIVTCLLAGFQLAAEGANFRDADRWYQTYTDGSGLEQGDPTTLRWSIVSDGVGVESSTSNLIGYLDSLYGAGPGGADLTTRPWFATIEDQFNNIAAKTGLSFEYVSDDGSGWNLAAATASRGDIRLAGYDLTAPGQLGLAQLPTQGGDILLDTANSSFANESTLATVFQHELGHALGLLHVSVTGHSVLMNTSNLPPAGPQFDDLYALTRLYGDAYESPAGNDDLATATQLGLLSTTTPIAIGTSSDDQTVARDEVDFASIDGAADVDYYQFDLAAPADLTLAITPQGPSYSYTSEGSAAESIVASELSDLRFEIIDVNSGAPLVSLNLAGIGQSESLAHFTLPTAGSYAVKVAGTQDANQFYRLDLSATESTPPSPYLLFHDRFDGTTAGLNSNLQLTDRQGTGWLDSPYLSSAANDSELTSVEVSDGTLSMTVVQGDESTAAQVAPYRNFAPQLDGERWLLSFDLSLTSSTAPDQAAFQFMIDDQWPIGEPMSDDPEISFRLTADGSYRLVENGGNGGGEAIRTGSVDSDVYHLQFLVDETVFTTRISVAINGTNVLVRETMRISDTEHYFGFDTRLLSGLAEGEWVQSTIDNFSIVQLTDVIAGDYNLDGVVDLGDYTLWRDQLGGRVLAGTSADGNGNGTIDSGDYDVWKANFGQHINQHANSLTASVPEPASLLTMLVVVSLLVGWRVGLCSQSVIERRPPVA